ncbi:DNA alkylation repair enzyme [Rubripirellula lacrimiformis]|uniref:DNA alkylation repair enzyme n=1 Tax=Rubripirellula lacrimiformis TaxID=1930273 RepID=A0A517NB64_9BACT|nr:DNA alkylation repair protein [Rubripirellula lacrimiformis]QDT04377.1 DNA alkylation repair enzyme [Rubripirellula lacrimiformis]
MNKNEVLRWLKENRDERGIAHWNQKPRGLKSFGIGLTKLRAFAKQIGKDHKLAADLWDSDHYDARILGMLVDDPKLMTRQQAQSQVTQLGDGMMSHVFASCGAPLAKTPFALELAAEWMDDDDAAKRRCGYSLLYELSKKNPKGMDDAFLADRIQRIRQTIQAEDMWVREAMASALMGIGKRTPALNKKAIAAAKAIGPIDVDYGDDNQCQALDVLKHLTSDHLKRKFAKP